MNMVFLKRPFFLLIALFFTFSIVRGQNTPANDAFSKYEKLQYSKKNGIVRVGIPYVIRINTQDDFSNLNKQIRGAIKQGKTNIEVLFSRGVFYYDKLSVYLYNINAESVSISIKGDQTVLVAGGKDYSKKSRTLSPNRKNIYLDEHLDLINLYGETSVSLGQVEVLDEKSKLCRVALAPKETFVPGMKIQLSQWYQSPVYDVTDIKNGFVYFIASNLEYDKAKKCLNVHYDSVISKIKPRVRLFNPAYLKNVTGAIHECEVSNFLTLYRVKLKSFSISGIEFCGSAKGEHALCYFRDVKTEGIQISDCKFLYINQRIIRLKKTPNFTFENNRIDSCFYGAVYSDIDCPNTIVKGNKFYRAEMGWTNSSCVVCCGEDFWVSNNQFEDIAYASITSGYWSTKEGMMISRGLIEYNEFFWGNDYYSHPEKYTLVDGGAIYLTTFSEDLVVRYNYFHNIRGVKSYRAIYCDDGAMNVTIYGNIICGFTDSHSILSWRAKSLNKQYAQTNDGINLFYNIIGGKYKMDERPNSSCVHGKNLIIYKEGEQVPERILSNFAYQEDDVYSTGASIVKGRLKLSDAAMKELKKFPTYSKMVRWIE